MNGAAGQPKQYVKHTWLWLLRLAEACVAARSQFLSGLGLGPFTFVDPGPPKEAQISRPAETEILFAFVANELIEDSVLEIFLVRLGPRMQ
jgi:hypothetical protein